MANQFPTILLAMPQYANSVKSEAAAAWLATASQQQRCRVVYKTARSSLLGRTFNELWAASLQGAEKGVVTHFAMLHADVAPETVDAKGKQVFWLDEMLDEMARIQVDILSAVVPIKDHRGLTSTAIDDPQDRFEPERRLTMHEILALPETFTGEDCFQAGLNPFRHALLVNTGCLLIDVRRPWVLGDWTVNRPCMFTVNDVVKRHPDGHWEVGVESEDWYFSREAHRWGARIAATRKIRLKHYGEIAWSNAEQWGTWKVDHDKIKEPPAADTPPPVATAVNMPQEEEVET